MEKKSSETSGEAKKTTETSEKPDGADKPGEAKKPSEKPDEVKKPDETSADKGVKTDHMKIFKLDVDLSSMAIDIVNDYKAEKNASAKQKHLNNISLIVSRKIQVKPKINVSQIAAIIDNIMLTKTAYDEIASIIGGNGSNGVKKIKAAAVELEKIIAKMNPSVEAKKLVYDYDGRIASLGVVAGKMKGGAGTDIGAKILDALNNDDMIDDGKVSSVVGNAYYLDSSKFADKMADGYKVNCTVISGMKDGADGKYVKNKKNPVSVPFLYKDDDDKLIKLTIAKEDGIDEIITELGGKWLGAVAANIIVKAYVETLKTGKSKMSNIAAAELVAKIKAESAKNIPKEAIKKYLAIEKIKPVGEKVITDVLKKIDVEKEYERVDKGVGNYKIPAVKKFVADTLVKNRTFYAKIFDLIKVSEPKKKMDILTMKIQDIPEGKEGEYKLIGKLQEPTQMGGYMIQMAGAGSRLAFFVIFEAVTFNGQKLSVILPIIYANPTNPSSVSGVNVPQPSRPQPQPPQPPRRPQQPPQNQTLYQWLMDPDRLDANGVPGWAKKEEELSQALLVTKRDKIWEYKGSDYNPKKDAGFAAIDGIKNTCGFVQNNSADCMAALERCLLSTQLDVGNCENLLDLSYKNITNTEAIELVSKMDPRLSFEILRAFHFGWYVEKSVAGRLKGLSVYKVEPLRDWIKEFITEQKNKKCFGKAGTVFSQNCNSISHHLGPAITKKIKDMINDPDVTKHGFLKFLGYLVDWVNANPTVLNSEIDFGAKPLQNILGSVATINIGYNVTGNTAENVSKMECAINNLQKINARRQPHDFVSMVQMARNVKMQFNRNMVANPHGVYRMNMTGGIAGVYDAMLNADASFVRAIYGSIPGKLQGLLRSVGNYAMTDKTIGKFNDKLNKMIECEKTIKKLSRDFMRNIEINKASNGVIDVSGRSDKDVKKLMEKHGLIQSEHENMTRYTGNFLNAASAVLNVASEKIKRPIFKT